MKENEKKYSSHFISLVFLSRFSHSKCSDSNEATTWIDRPNFEEINDKVCSLVTYQGGWRWEIRL